MGTHMPETIWLTLRPSRRLAAYLLLIHPAAQASLGLLQIPVSLRVLGVLPVLASLAWQIRRHVLMRGPGAVRRLHCRSDGS